MDKLKEGIGKKILEDLKKENVLFEKVCKLIEEDYANLWISIEELEKIREFLLEAVNLFLAFHPELNDLSMDDKKRFRELVHILIWNPNALLQETIEKEIKIIDKYGSEEWFSKIRPLVDELRNLIIKDTPEEWKRKWLPGLNVFTERYDKFSEASRDNDLKVKILEELINKDKKKRLLEIGFGTAPLLRRLWARGYDAIGIDSNEMAVSINPNLQRALSEKRIIIEKFEDYQFDAQYDCIFMESGILLFTILDDRSLVCEAYYGIDYYNNLGSNNIEKIKTYETMWDYHEIIRLLHHVHSGIKTGGIFLIGTQNILRNIDMGDGYVMSIKRTQLANNALRELFLHQNGKLIFYNRQRKRTMSYDDFCRLAATIGFKKVYVEPNRQWVVLEK